MDDRELRRLFDSLRDEPAIEALCHASTPENLYLEFKRKSNHSIGALSGNDAFHFSKALSAFGNSVGGVMVWGVGTNRYDRAERSFPITDVATFHSALKKSLLLSTQPTVDGVEVEIVPSAIAGSGYVRILIPESEKTPHRAMMADREYFRRTTEGSRRIEHFELEDMFGRRPRPLLNLTVRHDIPDPTDNAERLTVLLQNEGRGIAKYFGYQGKFGHGVAIAFVDSGASNDTDLNAGRPVFSFADNHSVIHPIPTSIRCGRVSFRRADRTAPVPVTFTWYCDGMRYRTDTIEIPAPP